MAELLLGSPLFPGESGVDQLVEIIKVRCGAVRCRRRRGAVGRWGGGRRRQPPLKLKLPSSALCA